MTLAVQPRSLRSSPRARSTPRQWLPMSVRSATFSVCARGATRTASPSGTTSRSAATSMVPSAWAKAWIEPEAPAMG